jgi:hypothetical protein
VEYNHKSVAILAQVFATQVSLISAMETTTLRSLLGDRRQDNAFVADGAADILVDVNVVHVKISAIHRALVAHEALNHLLTCMAQSPCGKFSEAIAQARATLVITAREARWLKHFNAEANQAKHNF